MKSNNEPSTLREVTGARLSWYKRAGIILLALSLVGCAGSVVGAPLSTADAAVEEVQGAVEIATAATGLADTPAAVSTSGLPANEEAYYKTMVFIQGTAQMMGKFNLAAISDNSAGVLALIVIPGLMDDRVMETEKSPLPADLSGAWGNALDARDGILGALEGLLSATLSQDEYDQQIGSITELASQAVADAEGVLSAGGASTESIALANRAALTEMGEAYQTIASLYVAGQSQSADDSQ